jgi:uncharacterized membrane protein
MREPADEQIEVPAASADRVSVVRASGDSVRSGLVERVSAVADRFVLWLSKRWLVVVNAAASVYVGLPLAAPALMYLGLVWPARLLHAVYKPLCHQLPQRSFFLFGPRLTYRFEELALLLGAELTDNPWSGAFAGEPSVGYKTALCQRDMAIYGTILVAGLAFGVIGRKRRVRPMPVWAYIIVGVLPMLIDGGFQWISYALATLLPSLGVIPHETTPVFRVATGSLFGMSTVWLAYPHVADTMEEVRESLEAKARRSVAPVSQEGATDVPGE